MTALAYLVGAIAFVLIAWACVSAALAPKTPVDREEDAEESERRIKQIVDSTRGTL